MNLKVLHILPSVHLGGAERVCLDLAKAQQAAGNDVAVLFLTTGSAADFAKKAGINAVVAEHSGVRSAVRAQRWNAIRQVLRQFVERDKPQIVHSHVPLTHLACHRVLPKLGIPWVASMHGSWRQFAYAPQTVGRIYLRPYLMTRHAIGDTIATRSAACVVAVSDYVKKDFVRVGVSAERITTIYNGLEFTGIPLDASTARARLGLPMHAAIFGAMGHFAPVKGFDIFVEAFARVAQHHSTALLVIAGGDVLGNEKPRREIERLIARLGIQERVRLLGTQDPRAGFMAALDVLVIASRTEGMPLTLLEGMWHRKASIVTSASGCAEAARPEREGLVFQSGNPADLAEKMDRLLRNPAFRETLGQEAWARASSRFTITRCASEYEAVYRRVIAAH